MKNLEKIFMIIAFLSALSSFIIALYINTSWLWQIMTMMWVIIAYFKNNNN